MIGLALTTKHLSQAPSAHILLSFPLPPVYNLMVINFTLTLLHYIGPLRSSSSIIMFSYLMVHSHVRLCPSHDYSSS